MKQAEQNKKKKSMDGITLEIMLVELSTYIGWEVMAQKVAINCFKSNPSIKSSLTFLRKTPWARSKVEVMYKFNVNKIEKAKLEAAKVDESKPKQDGLFPLDHFIQ